MEKMLLVTEVALLCRYKANATEIADFFPSQTSYPDTPEHSLKADESDDVLMEDSSTRLDIMDMLENWEEPHRASKDEMVRLNNADHDCPAPMNYL
jgi:hypothetical protein